MTNNFEFHKLCNCICLTRLGKLFIIVITFGIQKIRMFNRVGLIVWEIMFTWHSAGGVPRGKLLGMVPTVKKKVMSL